MENEEDVLPGEGPEEEIIPSEETEETTETIETEEPQVPLKKVEDDKPPETPEAKLARLRRMLAREEKKQGVTKESTPQESKTAEVTQFNVLDFYALSESKVPQEDVKDVTDYAKFKGISIAEALKTGVVKTMLADKAEERRSDNVASISTSRVSIKKQPSYEDVLNRVREKGEYDDPDELARARFEERKAKLKKN